MRDTTAILAQLSNVKKNGDGWTARCPSHPDTNNSLSIHVADHGGTVFKCFTGCSVFAIVAALGMDMSDICPSDPHGPMAVYTYTLADGTPTVQVRRYPPKDFRQFRWEAGAWVAKLLPTTPRVLYRLPELQGQATVWLVEGEKDADRLARAGLAATTKAGGASAWIADYTRQLQAAGVTRVNLVPDNDAPGRNYMRSVERLLGLVKIATKTIELPGLADKGDVSDWLVTHSIDDLRALAEEPANQSAPLWTPRTFEACGFSSYRLSLPHNLITLTVSRLRRDRGELVGELTVVCRLPGAQTVDGNLSSGDFNLSSVQARGTRAKHLAQRAKLDDADWEGWLHELVLKVIDAERKGSPPILLPDVVVTADPGDFDVHGLALPRKHPAILFGDGGSAKSLFALDVAVQLIHAGELVMYCDWEADADDHARRLRQLTDAPVPILYVRCERPLVHEADRLRTIAQEHGITYTVMDSAAYGCAGAPESAESALDYFRALRSLGPIGHLLIAHVTKSEDGDKRPFGSSFWHNSARATWHVRRSNPDEQSDELATLVTPRKANFGRLRPASSFRIAFSPDAVTIRRSSIGEAAQRDEFAPHVTVAQRVYSALRAGPLTREALAAQLEGVKPESIQKTLRRGIDSHNLIQFRHLDGSELIGLKRANEN